MDTMYGVHKGTAFFFKQISIRWVVSNMFLFPPFWRDDLIFAGAKILDRLGSDQSPEATLDRFFPPKVSLETRRAAFRTRTLHTVDGSEILHHLIGSYPIICRISAINSKTEIFTYMKTVKSIQMYVNIPCMEHRETFFPCSICVGKQFR